MGESSPRITVLMAAYNAAETIGRAIDSCVQQTFDDWELVVVDDASEDGTGSVVRGIDDPRVHLITFEHNQGEGAARNAAIDAALGAWFTILDADDAFLPTRLERLHDLAEKLGSTDNVLVDRVLRVLPTAAGFVPLRHLPERIPIGHHVLEPAAAVRQGVGGQPYFSRELLDRTGARYPTDSHSGVDTAFVLRLLGGDGARFVRVHDPLYLYATYEGSQSRILDRYDHVMAALEPLVTDETLPLQLRAEIGQYVADLQRERPFEELRAAVRARRPLRAAGVAIRHPSVLRSVPSRYRTHRRYQAVISDAQRFADDVAATYHTGEGGA